MATVATTPRTNQITLANTSAGPFLVGFRLFASDGLDVYLNGVRQTSGFTVAATFVDGYDDNASVTFAAAQPPGTVIQFDGALIPGRAADYFNPDPTLTAKLNLELARLWSSVSEINQLVRRSVRGLDAIEAVDGINPADLANLPANLAAAAAAATTATGAALTATTARDQVLAVQDSLPEWRGPWVTARVYGLGDLVSQAGSSYICIVAHTSGTFSTDLANGRWQLFAQQGAAGAGTGDMLAANNLSDVANAATARANLGAQASNALLSAIAALAGNGLMGRTGAGTAVARTITAGAGIQVTNGDGVSGNPTIAASNIAIAQMAAGTIVTESEGIAGNDNDSTLPTSAAVKDYVDGRTPVRIRAAMNFNAIALAGTYSRTGTLVTVTMTAHGMTTGQACLFTVQSGGATNNYSAVVTVIDANTFTYVDGASGATSGNITRRIWMRSYANVNRIIYNGAGDYTIEFFTAMPNGNYVVTGSAKRGGLNEPGIFVPIEQTAATVRVVTGSGSFAPSDSDLINVMVVG